MNTAQPHDEDLIDLGAFTAETKGEQQGLDPDHPVLPTFIKPLGLSAD